MRVTGLLIIGALALLAMEVAYSAQIRKVEAPRYATSDARPAFFCGPITATLKGLLNLDAPAEPTAIHNI